MMNLAKLICALLLLAFCENTFAQADDHWESYIASYEKGLGITLLNMSLKEKAPVKDQGFVLITGVTFSDCKDGLPTPEMVETLQSIDDALARQVSFLGKTTFAGSWTHNCERLLYFYLQDSMDVRFSLQTFYKDNYPAFKHYINIRHDPEWEGYLKFLYPNEIILEQLNVSKVLLQLAEAGDKRDKERPVDYSFFFPDGKNRSTFIEQMKQEGFRVADQPKKVASKDRPGLVTISKPALPDASTISGMIIYLRKKAAGLGGEYKGWETVPVKN
ncbi:TIGR01619 family protein [Chitinophaga niabensis]|uniref:TIGR01619 family protein n=2 Tax=Chitinophaga niabensis TaxID=536979 RepID=A0A1N6D7Z8_9BACT|nr:TIGR01619 family protein [Chitinophaga niabensis]